MGYWEGTQERVRLSVSISHGKGGLFVLNWNLELLGFGGGGGGRGAVAAWDTPSQVPAPLPHGTEGDNCFY